MLQAFPPICGDKPKTLILGTFPSPLSRERGEYYGNPKNQFWRLMFELFGQSHEGKTYDEKRGLLISRQIALWDVLISCEVEGALDSDIRNPVYNTEIPGFIKERGIERIIFNGGNARKFCRRGIADLTGTVLPSTSPANARYSYAMKLEAWKKELRQGEN